VTFFLIANRCFRRVTGQVRFLTLDDGSCIILRGAEFALKSLPKGLLNTTY
jgi:hypothetical protein